MSKYSDVTLSDEEYLELFKISEKKFLIGVYQDGISVYKQQIRALNIFYALISTKRIRLDGNFTIGIIGGGVAGLTFAAAALKEQIKVVILEEKSIFLHMQHNCDTRKIHPNIYEWPDSKSTFPNTELPVLNWKYDTASNFRKQMLYGFEEVKKSISDLGLKLNDYLYDYTNCSVVSVTPSNHYNVDQLDIVFQSDKGRADSSVDILILAMGYGVERGVSTVIDTPSYWRNDSFGQSLLYKSKKQKIGKKVESNNEAPDKIKFLISGFGDGGLIDLFRLKIFDFSYDLIIDIINRNSKGKELYEKLMEIKDTFDSETNPHDHLFLQFSGMNRRLYTYIDDELKSRNLYQNNIEIILNDRDAENFKVALNYKKISMINAFIAFTLFRDTPFIHGDLDIKKNHKCFINKIAQDNIHTIIIRHGTDIDGVYDNSVLLNENGNKEALLKIKTLQKEYSSPTVNRRWNFEKLILNSNKRNKSSNDDLENTKPTNFIRQIENIIPETVALFTHYISILKNVLEKTSNGKNFRVSIHRIISLRGVLYFQQITSYFGHGVMISDEGTSGQVFKINRGSVGYSIKSGKPLLLKRVESDSFESLVSALNLGSDYSNVKKLNSCFSLPILSPVKVSKKTGLEEFKAVNLVLYIDSSEESFFDDNKTIELIISSTRGLIESINSLIKKDYISMNELDFLPLPVDETFDPFKEVTKKCVIGFEDDFPDLTDGNKLVLPNYYSFDIINNKRYSLTTEL